MSIITAAGLIVIGGIALLIDLVFALFAVVTVLLAFLVLVSPRKRTTGEVIDIGKGRTALGTRVRVAYYTPDGRSEIDASVQRPRLGQQLSVRYKPGQPERASTVSAASFGSRLVGIIPAVAVFGALAYGMVISGVWYFTRSHTSLQAPVGGGSFFLAFALLFALAAVRQYSGLLRRHRMTLTQGEILRRVDEPKPGTDEVRGVLVSFKTTEGETEEFWAQSNVSGKRGDSTDVYYDPGQPGETATVETARERRGTALTCTAFTVFFGICAVLVLVST